jgi:periplasmic copper chaperone A
MPMPIPELIMNRGSALLVLSLLAGPALFGQVAAAPPPGPAATEPGAAVPLVEGAWVRSAVPGQQGTGAFMKLTAPRAMELVGVSTPIAGTAQVHEMKLEGDIMRMRAVAKLALPAGKTVELKPGGFHLMLMDLKQPVRAGTTVPLTLVFREAGGAQGKLELIVPVTALPPADMHKH